MQPHPSKAIVSERSVVFLFNHDATHQLAHTAGILKALTETAPSLPLVCAYGTPAIAQGVRNAVGVTAAARISWFDLSVPQTGLATRLLNRIAPAERLSRLSHHASALQKASLIVSPERTCLQLKKHWKGGGPQFIFVPHGAGDRSVTYHRDMAEFDAMLVSGPKVADEMIRHGLAQQRSVAIIGYPKFDLIDRNAPRDFFANGRPTFVYNPHFDPHLSSWYRHGHDIINWFAFGPGQVYNLIFAPHVLLFRKKLHISLEYKVMKRRPDLDARWKSCDNILIDVDSERLSNMSYTLGSDAYIGDVSSQIYEFLWRPRPAFFIDTHPRDHRADPPYLSWTAGDVFHSSEELLACLPHFRERGRHFHARQEEIFQFTMANTIEPSSIRGARAILSWLEKGRFDLADSKPV